MGAPARGRPLSGRTTRLLATIVVVVVTALVWWIQGQGSPEAERAEDRATTSSSTSPSAPARAGSPGGEMPGADEHGIAYVALEELPPEAAETVALIDRGGPFPHPGKDGSTFGNFEGQLPDRPRGYYAEYTVETPGLDHRGARRIVAGDGGELFWTEDHYESFERVWR